jgi:hypothetical protein
MAVADLSKWRTANGRNQILAHIRRNFDKHYAPGNVQARVLERTDALDSLGSLRACRAWARASDTQTAFWIAPDVDGFDFNVESPRPGECDSKVVEAMKNMFIEPDLNDPSAFDKLPTFPRSDIDYTGSWIPGWWLYGSLVQSKSERDDEELPADAEGTALTEEGLGGILEALLDDDDRAGNVDDGGDCQHDLEDPTQTACHQDEDEDLDLADEQDEIDDQIEAQVEELEPEEGGGAAAISEEAGEEEDSADAQTSAQAALPSAHAAANRGASRLGRTLKNSQFLADYDLT